MWERPYRRDSRYQLSTECYSCRFLGDAMRAQFGHRVVGRLCQTPGKNAVSQRRPTIQEHAALDARLERCVSYRKS